MAEKRVGHGGVRFPERDARHRPRVHGLPGLAIGKRLDRRLIAVLGRGHAEEFEEAAEADDDLAIERIGLRQKAFEIAVERDLALGSEVDEPRLPVVRIGRQDGIGKRPHARVRVGARRAPTVPRWSWA